tara:strand:+ start:3237 stop:3476 length:240 start_codon:yes stop_codon:yes gene_type:complete
MSSIFDSKIQEVQETLEETKPILKKTFGLTEKMADEALENIGESNIIGLNSLYREDYIEIARRVFDVYMGDDLNLDTCS